MTTMNDKIKKIKTSCKTGRIVSKILMIICIVGASLAFAGGIMIFADLDRAELGLNDLTIHMNIFDSEDFMNIESDIPALQRMFDAHPVAAGYGTYAMTIAAIVAVAAVLMGILSGTFKLIENSDTPFTTGIRNRITVCLAVVAGCLGVMTNTGFAAVTVIAAWVIFNIMDYGIALQTESDETL